MILLLANVLGRSPSAPVGANVDIITQSEKQLDGSKMTILTGQEQGGGAVVEREVDVNAGNLEQDL